MIVAGGVRGAMGRLREQETRGLGLCSANFHGDRVVTMANRVLDFALPTGCWDSNVQSRSQEFIPEVGRSPEKSSIWGGSWPGQGARRCLGLNWASVLMTPQKGRLSTPNHLLRTYYALGSRWGVFHALSQSCPP